MLSVHRRAIYLRFDDELMALVGPGVEAGPLHLAAGSTALPPARPGEPVRIDGIRVTARRWAVRCDVPDRIGVLPESSALLAARAGQLPPAASPPLRRDVQFPPEVPVPAAEIVAAVRAGDLGAAAGLLGGRGPGLTPAGDDVLAGLLLAARALRGPAAEAWLTAVATEVRTTVHAAAFLRWAARGQGLRSVHDWMAAVAAGTDPEPARRRLARIGASSGRCLLAGLRLGIAQLPVDTQSSRAGEPAGLWQRTS
ncbi:MULTISPECIES: oxamate carbamoyltransferase subunit AllH family protein [Pseudonocardia]|uniref:oxamate carbamoyltransferase subunit AllH family protein n=1 Tax=Pseudonocardia TaxID=1847 RepID=UPI0013025E91|nr:MULTISPECIES: DUF2877 domain-containing protein [Pseudonocardia]